MLTTYQHRWVSVETIYQWYCKHGWNTSNEYSKVRTEPIEHLDEHVPVRRQTNISVNQQSVSSGWGEQDIITHQCRPMLGPGTDPLSSC